MPHLPKLPPASVGLPSAGGLLRLAPLRPAESVVLDQELPPDTIPYLPWETFRAGFKFEQGEHCTMVAVTQSGKTTLARYLLLPRRRFVVVLATKARDPNLYGPLQRQGFVITDKFQAEWTEGAPSKVIFRPPLGAPTRAAQAGQQDAFRAALVEVFDVGGWAVYADEVRYLTDNLRLQTEFETLWLQGATLGVSMIVATQRPVSIPLLAFDQATHLFLWRNTDRRNIDRMAEFAGADSDLVRYTIPRLPQYEFLYIDTRTGQMARSRVQL